MIHLKQLYKHDPDNGVYGDCWRTCWAMVLDRPLRGTPQDFHGEGIPHFLETGKNGYENRDAYLLTLGLFAYEHRYHPDCDLDTLVRALPDCIPTIITGRGPRGENHCVVAYEGEIVDPYTGSRCPGGDDSCLIGPALCADDTTYWMVEVPVQFPEWDERRIQGRFTQAIPPRSGMEKQMEGETQNE